jgi:hypothetical protein
MALSSTDLIGIWGLQTFPAQAATCSPGKLDDIWGFFDFAKRKMPFACTNWFVYFPDSPR